MPQPGHLHAAPGVSPMSSGGLDGQPARPTAMRIVLDPRGAVTSPRAPASGTVPSAATRASDLVAGLEKGLAVIEAFGQEGRRLSISEVAVRTGLTRAAARRYLLTLAHLGYAYNDGKSYTLMPLALSLGQSYLQSARLPRVIQPQLERLSAALQEASGASVLEHDDVVTIAAVGVARSISATVHPGRKAPAHSTSEGRVLVAALPDAAMAAWIARQALGTLTHRTLTDPADLLAELRRVRSDGYAVVDQEGALGLRTVSVPLRNYAGSTVAALTIGVQGARLSVRELVERSLPALLSAQDQLRALL